MLNLEADQLEKRSKPNLVYYCVSGDGYQDLAIKSIETLLNHQPQNVDVLIICDSVEAERRIRNRISSIKTFVFEENCHPSFFRFGIFKWQEAKNYEKLLYIDADTLVLKDVNEIFSYMENDNLYVNCGYESDLSHKNYTFDLSQEEIEDIRRRSVQGINTGVIGFHNSNLAFFEKLFEYCRLNRFMIFTTFEQPYFGTFLYRSKINYHTLGDPLHTPGATKVMINNEAGLGSCSMKDHVILHYAGQIGDAFAKSSKINRDYQTIMRGN